MRITELQLRKIVRDQLLTEAIAFPFLLFWGSQKSHDDMEEILGSSAFLNILTQSATTLLGIAFAGTKIGHAIFAGDLTAAISDYKNDQSVLSALFVALGIIPMTGGLYRKGKTGAKAFARALKDAGINDKTSLIAAVKNSGKGRPKLTSEMIQAWEMIDRINRARGLRPLFPGGLDKILKTGKQSQGGGIPQSAQGASRAKIPKKPPPQNKRGPVNHLQGFKPGRN